MSQSLRVILVACGSAALLTGVQGCWNPFDPDEGDPEPTEYYDFCDSSWKVLANLELAYVSKDLEKYLSCFRSDFEFHLLETDWADYSVPPDGTIDTFWGLDREEYFTTIMFDSLDTIDLSLTGTVDEWWSGSEDSTYRYLLRQFVLTVYNGDEGFIAQGDAEFICRPDSTGEYYIWYWNDLSEVQ
jgi:hypothetical protein